ncbi:topoisomerase DNA-binding C4 zinc finger domain-containing protein [Desulfobacterales bacterium HSG17]|nr:topoisomerase DNA-binding C4 zinc finger domain-containing protein [Desulfobacterales bacterium HSG17]
MEMNEEQNNELDPAFVREQLDAILAQEIKALLDVGSNAAMMSFNLASISCITLIIERENEVQQFSDFPPERYTKDSFIDELMEIGLEKNEALEKSVDTVMNTGYISTDSNGELKAEMPAFMMVGFLDNMFPGMQGINLVAFILQINDEVNSGRKSLDIAKDSFKSTLKSRGVSVSKDKAQKKAKEMVSGKISAPPAQSRKVSQKLKKANLGRLSKLVSKRKKTSSSSSEQFKIKDVFDKGPTKEEIEAEKAKIKQAEEDAKKTAELAKELALKDEKIQEAQEAARLAAQQLEEIQEREKQLQKAQEEAHIAAQKASQLEEREAEMAQKEAQLKALEEKLKLEDEEKAKREETARQKQIEDEEKEKASKDDDDIEAQIAALESSLTMPCPMCKDGEIVAKTTEKGKEFYSCTKPDCRFVSWDKPYHFECPLCKNSFLIETTVPDGEKGLKCPRASCSYTQNNLFDPKQNMVQSAAAAAPKKKKKRVVRRKKRR